MCEIGTVGKISDYQSEGPGFNPRRGRGLNFAFGRPFATPYVRGQGHSIGGLKRTHVFLNRSRVIPVLWTVNSGRNSMSQTEIIVNH